MYGFLKFKIIQSFGGDNRNDISVFDVASDEQEQLAKKRNLENLPVIQKQNILI